jgi:hypothetical protein
MSLRIGPRFGSLHPDTGPVFAIVVAFAAAGALAGWVVASGRPVMIALTLGAILGAALLNALPLVIWTVLVGVLVVSGPLLMFVPALEKVAWLFALLGFFLMGASILYAALGRERPSGPLPAFVSLAALFIAYALVSLLHSAGPLDEGVRAFKRYFQFHGLLFVLAVVPFAPALVRRWGLFLAGLALIQLPFALYQRIVLVPMREGMPKVVPLDIVVGTMEGTLNAGGSSSVMALLLVFVLAFLVAAWREGVLPLRRFLLLAGLVAAPLPLGEVTVIAVLIPLALGAVFFDLVRRQPMRFVVAAAFAVPLVALFGWAYLALNGQPGESIDRMIAAVIAYNFGETGYYGGHSLNRTSVHVHWFQEQGLANPVAILFGHGLGASFGGVGEPVPGHLDVMYSGFYISLTAMSSVLWDLGLVGASLLLAVALLAVREAARLVQAAEPGADRARCRALFALSLMLVPMLFYSNAAISVPSQQAITGLCLGMIAWRARRLSPGR